jgi:hypothetical protein
VLLKKSGEEQADTDRDQQSAEGSSRYPLDAVAVAGHGGQDKSADCADENAGQGKRRSHGGEPLMCGIVHNHRWIRSGTANA